MAIVNIKSLAPAFLLIILFALSSVQASSANETIYIGVLSHRGEQATKKMWSPMAEYLSSTLKPKKFEIMPLGFDEIEPAVKNEIIDFLLVNSGIYVNMEVRYRVSRIVTLNNSGVDDPLNKFGGVIFTRSDRDDINQLIDLKGKSYIAVDAISLGGFQMAWGELKKQKINPYDDFSELAFGSTHDEVVRAVRKGEFDVGTIRTNILERMAADGDISLDEFKIINPLKYDEFPYLVSTALYPEWPFSKLKHTSNLLAQQVAVALMNMDIDAVKSAFYSGWTVPLDYQAVHELFKELKLPPYDQQTRFTLYDAVKKYWVWLVIILIFLIFMTIMSTWVARLNRQLKKSKLNLERQYELILNSVCDGIYGVDLEGNCTFINKSMEVITGWKAAEMIGRNQHELMHHSKEDGTLHPPEHCPVYMTFRDNLPRFVKDDVFWKKDGSSFPVEYSCTPIRDNNARPVGSVVVFRDNSERKQAEEASLKHQADMAHMARLNTMGEMASGIAHELNQPLTAIATNAFASIQMLESGSIMKDKLSDILERIGRQAERSGEIIRHLRQFVSKEQPRRKEVNLNSLIEEVLLLTRHEIRKANVRIVLQLDNGLKPVYAQPIQIEQVVLNLLKNAIEAMVDACTDKKIITIRTQMGGKNAIIVSVSDSGPGISQTIRNGLFAPFVTSKENGMGLGLSISQGIIEAHHGNLYLDSSSSTGTVFRFSLPVD